MNRMIPLIVLAISVSIGTVAGAEEIDAYAPPLAWSPSYSLTPHIGSTTYNVQLKPVGATLVIAEITYFDRNGQLVTQEFREEIRFTTGDAYAVPRIRLKGVPLGSAVKVHW